jgi:pectate lyase
VRVENNYFENVGKAVFNDQSPEVGYVHLLENHFGSASYVTEPTCILNVPYIYESVLDATEDIPAIVGDTTVPVAFSGMAVSGNSMTVYPNPADHEINLLLKTTGEGIVNITLRDISGRIIKTFPVQKITRKMQPLKIHVDDLYPGPYFLEVTTQYSQQIGKIVILR